MSINKRIKKIRTDNNQSQAVFAKNIGISRGALASIELENQLPPLKTIKAIVDNYNISYNYLFDDTLDVEKVDISIVSEPVVKYIKSDSVSNSGHLENQLIPLIPLSAVAGTASGDNSTILQLDCEYYNIPEFHNKADYLIRITGASMSPKFHSGDVVACKIVPLTTSFFQWNKVYVIDTDQGALVKRVKKSDLEGCIKLVSDNEKYDPFDLDRKSINALGLVIGVIRLE